MGDTFSRKQGSISRIERQRVDRSGIEVVCFKVATFLTLIPGDTEKLFERSLVGLRQAATVFIVGSQAILQVCQVRPEVRQSPETDAACCTSLDQATLAAICSRASFTANASESYWSRNR